jgi:hypothetical protein
VTEPGPGTVVPLTIVSASPSAATSGAVLLLGAVTSTSCPAVDADLAVARAVDVEAVGCVGTSAR